MRCHSGGPLGLPLPSARAVRVGAPCLGLLRLREAVRVAVVLNNLHQHQVEALLQVPIFRWDPLSHPLTPSLWLPASLRRQSQLTLASRRHGYPNPK